MGQLFCLLFRHLLQRTSRAFALSDPCRLCCPWLLHPFANQTLEKSQKSCALFRFRGTRPLNDFSIFDCYDSFLLDCSRYFQRTSVQFLRKNFLKLVLSHNVESCCREVSVLYSRAYPLFRSRSFNVKKACMVIYWPKSIVTENMWSRLRYCSGSTSIWDQYNSIGQLPPGREKARENKYLCHWKTP